MSQDTPKGVAWRSAYQYPPTELGESLVNALERAFIAKSRVPQSDDTRRSYHLSKATAAYMLGALYARALNVSPTVKRGDKLRLRQGGFAFPVSHDGGPELAQGGIYTAVRVFLEPNREALPCVDDDNPFTQQALWWTVEFGDEEKEGFRYPLSSFEVVEK